MRDEIAEGQIGGAVMYFISSVYQCVNTLVMSSNSVGCLPIDVFLLQFNIY